MKISTALQIIRQIAERQPVRGERIDRTRFGYELASRLRAAGETSAPSERDADEAFAVMHDLADVIRARAALTALADLASIEDAAAKLKAPGLRAVSALSYAKTISGRRHPDAIAADEENGR